MKRYLTGFIITVLCFSALDFIWLGTVAFDFYKAEIGALLRPQPNWNAGLSFYLIYLIGIFYFSVCPGLRSHSALKVLGHGALFGLIAYGTYDLTNMATLSGWSWRVVAVDIAWGTFATGLTGLLACLATFRLTRPRA